MKKLYLITLAIFVTIQITYSQTEVGLGGAETESENTATTILVKIKPELDKIFNDSLLLFKVQDNSFQSIEPNVEIQLGDEDAFSALVMQVQLLGAKFKTTEVAGIETPAFNEFFHVYSLGLGVETDQNMETLNGLIEVGYVPWYMNKTKSSILRKTRFGFFLQGGNKFSKQSVAAIGGKNDESEEGEDEGLLRFKNSFIYSPTIKISENFKIKPEGSSVFWYDILNSAIYYNLKGAINFNIGDYTFELKYEKGSGAPNFNEGDQFGGAFKIKF